MDAVRATREARRLDEARSAGVEWMKWGAYLAERQWGTVREDYSASGDAWGFFTHDMARSRAYRWGEDGIAGLSDDKQRLCLSLALWNERDPILKERLFGLTNSQGNHGEDVKECYHYLDATPTHSYLKAVYRYPQKEYPYALLIEENARRGREDPEFELADTGVFDADRYFDVFVEYAKAGPEEIVVRVRAVNAGPDEAALHVLPQVVFRNTWSWGDAGRRPEISLAGDGRIASRHAELGEYSLRAFTGPGGDGGPQWLFTENETNPRVFGQAGARGHFKDAFHDLVVGGDSSAVNPENRGTKATAHFRFVLQAGGEAVVRLRLVGVVDGADRSLKDVDAVVDRRQAEADEFYGELQAEIDDPDARTVQRQAFAGLIWSKVYYYYDVRRWLEGDPGQVEPPPERRRGRNSGWIHLNNADVLSVPDKWEYPWYASWDTAFHCIPLALVDPEFAKGQLVLLGRVWYLHPNGQIPAYEWGLSDVNPPVHAWAAWRVFQIDRKRRGGEGDLGFLERVFHKLLLNFTWWVNRKDAHGQNFFQGGFLGLDNIGVFDRSRPLPTGGHIDQADGTSWMAMYCLNLMRIALELAQHNHVYEDIATKFFEHFLYIAEAMTKVGGEGIGLWDEEDEFFYDVLDLPDRTVRLKLRSMVGLAPLLAVETLEPELLAKVPVFAARLEWFLEHRPELAALVSRWTEPGRGERRLLSLLRGHRMKRLLKRMLDPEEFLSPYGVRSLSKHHEKTPYVFDCCGRRVTVRYVPSESDSDLFGGNSNWRGPVWFPMNYLIIESLQKFHHYYTDDFKVECPTGSGRFTTIDGVAKDLTRRLACLFLRDGSGRRPLCGPGECRHEDRILFHEYFHGDTGQGLGASHQTGWTALVAKLLQPRREER
ncbi:MAG: MGH1-like glycoside hydrolase domain-containing protein [Planctomycetota bacterium]